MISRYLFWIDEVFLLLITMLAVLTAIWSVGHALLHKRDPRSALVWVIISISIPVLGPLSYWILGINRITRRALRWQKHGRRLSGHELFASRQNASAALLPVFEPVRELSRLGDMVVRNRLIAGNRLEPLENGEGAYPAMIAAINGAQTTVNLSSYIFDADGAGSAFVDALAGAAARGVAVRVIVDAMGERYSSRTARGALASSGVDIRLYLPLSKGPFINLRNHRKLLVVDGNQAFTGGMNIRTRHCITQSSPTEATRDLHFKVCGPVVADLQRIFVEDWHFVSGDLLDDKLLFPTLPELGTAVVRAIADGPDREFRKLEWIVMGALSVARKRVRIMTPYFIPDRPMITALTTAALRGVEVTMVLPSQNNLPFVAWASRASYWELIKNGVIIAEQAAPFAHTKLMVIDDLWSLVGSANLDTRSLRLNFELNLSVYDIDFATILNKHFDDALSRGKIISASEMDSRPLHIRLRDNAARLFSPYL